MVMATTSTAAPFLLFTSYLAVFSSVAVGSSTQGNTFYTGFISLPTFSSNDKKFQLRVLTLSKAPVAFNVSSSSGFYYSGYTAVDNPTLVDIPDSFEVKNYAYEYRNLGLIIESSPSELIFVLGVIKDHEKNRLFTTFEVHPYIEQPTKEYVYYGISFGANVDHFSQLLLIGCRNNTTITIKPSQNITVSTNIQEPFSENITIQARNSYAFLLHKLQTLILYAYNITGTKIVSNKPLSVISGHSCTHVPFGFSDCDAITTQVPPTINWGTTFILPPLSERKNGQRYKVIASENNTEVDIQCNGNTLVNTQFIDEGDVYQFDTGHNEYCSVVTSKPCYIAEAGFSKMYLQENYGDPLMLTIPPIEQYAMDVILAPLPTAKKFYTIIIPLDEYYTGNLLFNKIILSPKCWIPVNYPNGSVAGYGYSAPLNENATISSFNHRNKFLVTAYGFSNARGYGYTPNMEFNPINVPPVYIRFVSQIYYAVEESRKVVVSIEKHSKFYGDVSVNLRTKNFIVATADEIKDYIAVDTTIILRPNQTIFNLTIVLVDDDIKETTEYFTIEMISLDRNVIIDDAEAVVVIRDEDGTMSNQETENSNSSSNNYLVLIFGILFGVSLILLLLIIIGILITLKLRNKCKKGNNSNNSDNTIPLDSVYQVANACSNDHDIPQLKQSKKEDPSVYVYDLASEYRTQNT